MENHIQAVIYLMVSVWWGETRMQKSVIYVKTAGYERVGKDSDVVNE